jgi:hypothetical protein
MKLLAATITVAGGVVIGYLQWPLAVRYGGQPPYGMGIVGTILLECVLTGIGTVIWAAIVGVALLRGRMTDMPHVREDDIHGSGERISPSDIADRFKSHW